MAQDKKHIIFIHKAIERIGELATQIWRLRNVIDEDEYQLTILTMPIYNPRINKSLYNVVMRDVNVINTLSDLLHTEIPPIFVTESNNSFAFLNGREKALFANKFKDKTPHYFFHLTDYEFEKGLRIRKKLSIPESAPIVTVHLRDTGYLRYYHYHNYRNPITQHYIPAIKYLIDEGYYVVRIGDKSMQPIVNAPPQFVDAPFHSDYSDFFDTYFLANSSFYFGSSSGPMTVASAFNVPLLITDAPMNSSVGGTKQDLLVLKKYYSHQLNRYLSYEESLMLPIVDYLRSECFKNVEIDVVANSIEEILMACKEMVERLNGTYSSYQNAQKANQYIKEINNKAYYLRQKNNYDSSKYSEELNKNEILYFSFDDLFVTPIQISYEFLKLNPYFLGHICS